MVKSPATAATMAYPTEEERRSHPRTSGIKGDDSGDGDGDADDDGDDDDDVVRSNGNRDALSRHVRGITGNSDVPSNTNRNSKGGAINNNDFLYSYNPPFPYGPLGPIDDSSQEQALSLKISQYTAGQNEGYYENQENKENQAKQEKKEKYNALHQRRGRKQSRPKQVIWNRDTYGTPDSFGNVRTIPALGILQDITRDISQNVSQNVSQDIAQDISQDITQGITQNASQNISQAITQDIKPNITSDVKQEDPPLNSVLTKYDKTREKMTMLRKLILTRKLRQQLMRQRLFRCYLCGEDESARAKCRRPYHTKASLTLHKLWHKHKSHRLYRRSHRQTISNRVQGALLLGQAEGHLDRPTQDINIASNIQGREYRLPLSESQTFQTQLTFKCCSY